MTTKRWIACQSELAGRYDDIFMLSDMLGWAVNGNGNILKTENGFDWKVVFSSRGTYFRSLSMVDDKTGWAGCTTPGSELFRTSDGMEWNLVTNLPRENQGRTNADAPTAVCGLWALDSDNVFASGTNYPERPARFLKTNDGGATWFCRDMEDVATILVDIYFRTPDIGFVVGGRATRSRPRRNDVVPVVLKTVDGGITWEEVSKGINGPLGEWGWKIQFLDDDELFGVVACENLNTGAILVTEDGGNSWIRREVRDANGELVNQNLEGIGFISRTTGWVGGWGDPSFDSGRTSVTYDGGRTWADLTGSWPKPLDAIRCPETRARGQYINRFRIVGDTVFASGNTIYKYTAQQLTEPEPQEMAASQFLAAGDIFCSDNLELTVTLPDLCKSASVVIYDRFTGKVREIPIENPRPGAVTVQWDFTDDDGNPRKPGQYLLRVTCDGASESRLIFAARETATAGAADQFTPHVLREN